MPELDDSAPIADDELLYRRIPASQNWYHPGEPWALDAEAFKPRKSGPFPDTTGISLFRAKFYDSPADVGSTRKGFYVAVLRAGDLRIAQIDVTAKPDPDHPGHAELPQLRADNQKTDECRNLMLLLTESLCLRVEGPFRLEE
jgi:hypothetical protein